MKLNLGCGNKPLEHFVNHDLTKHAPYVAMAHDLNELPWPWEDDQFESVVALSVLEHLYHSLLVSMNEIWRITEPDGLVIVKLPYWKAEISWDDPTHIHKAGKHLMHQFDPTTRRGQQYGFYTPRKWEIIEGKFNDQRSSLIWHLRKRPLHWTPEEPDDDPN